MRDEHEARRTLAPDVGHVDIVAEHVGIEGLLVGDLGVRAVERELPAVERAGELVDRTEVGQGRAGCRDAGQTL